MKRREQLMMAVVAAALAGCSLIAGTDKGKLTNPTGDPTTDGGPTGDSGTTCGKECDDGIACTEERCQGDACLEPVPMDARCDDGIDCTEDRCDPAAAGADADGCVITPKDSLCTDFCHPDAVCSVAAKGCDLGPLDDCGAVGGCQEGQCSLEKMECTVADVDADGDGHSPESCAGGDDCDDTRATVHPGAAEICDNNRDDDCDGNEDEESCTEVPDRCDSVRQLTLGAGGQVTFNGTFADYDDDYESACATSSGPDAVFFVDVPSDRDVRVETVGSAADTLVAVSVGAPFAAQCDGDAWRVCNADATSATTDARVWIQGLAGSVGPFTRVFILVDSAANGETGAFKLTVSTSPRSSRSCGGATVPNVSAGGTFLGSLSGRSTGDQAGSCQATDAFLLDSALRFTPAATGTVELRAVGEFEPIVYVREAPCTGGTEVACASDATQVGDSEVTTLSASLTAGTDYFVFVDGGGRGAPYVLQVKP